MRACIPILLFVKVWYGILVPEAVKEGLYTKFLLNLFCSDFVRPIYCVYSMNFQCRECLKLIFLIWQQKILLVELTRTPNLFVKLQAEPPASLSNFYSSDYMAWGKTINSVFCYGMDLTTFSQDSVVPNNYHSPLLLSYQMKFSTFSNNPYSLVGPTEGQLDKGVDENLYHPMILDYHYELIFLMIKRVFRWI